MTHTCGTPITYRIVLDDYGQPAVVRWCATCEAVPDNPEPFTLREVPAEMLWQLVLTESGGKKIQ
jgi:hypothetical protein